MNNGVRATWHLNRDCNYRCSYCYVSKMRNHGGQRGHGVDTDIAAFKKNKINWKTILMSGGEPFIYPDYVELCKKLTDFSNIEINTNCSTPNIYDFADTIDPEKVNEIHVSLHIEQRKQKHWQLLADKIHYLEERKFPVWVSEVFHPDIISDYQKAYYFFKNQGICIAPKVFEGYYRGHIYPCAYTKKAKELFTTLSRTCDEEPPPLLHGFLTWSGKTCDAGYRFLQIQYSGDAFRCQAEKTYLGNLYEGDITLDDHPRKCHMPICTCAYEGLQHADGKPTVITRPPLGLYIKKTGEHYLQKIR